MISYWPEGVEREETLSAFRKAYATKGFQVCADERFEDGYEKIAVYIDGLGKPQHAARQLIGEVWSSKLGEEYDIIHPFIHEWGIIGYHLRTAYFDFQTRKIERTAMVWVGKMHG